MILPGDLVELNDRFNTVAIIYSTVNGVTSPEDEFRALEIGETALVVALVSQPFSVAAMMMAYVVTSDRTGWCYAGRLRRAGT